MTRLSSMLLAVVSVVIAVAGCGTRVQPGAPGTRATSSVAPAATPSVYESVSIVGMPVGGPNPEATIQNPGAGPGNPLLARALLRQSAPPRLAATQLAPGVVTMPDRDLGSMFIALRQYGTPVVGPKACDKWTAGLSAAVLANFNEAGVQLGVEHGGQTPGPGFAETIITGPPSVLDTLADSPLPAACRDINTPHYSGGVKPITATVPSAASTHAFEITGTGKVPVWMWAEVVRGQNFILEIRIPIQSESPAPGVTLPGIAAAAYNHAAKILT
jgi:hypothetical protein